MNGIADAVLGWLFGGAPMDNGIDWEAKARSDEQRARRQRLDQAYANGWKDWIPPYTNTLDRAGLPYDYPRVWIWRLEWEFPSEVDPNGLDPAMNAVGLLWKPWKPSDSHNPIAHNQSA